MKGVGGGDGGGLGRGGRRKRIRVQDGINSQRKPS